MWPLLSLVYSPRRGVALLALLVASQGSLAQDHTEPFQVGVLYWSMNIPGQVAMRHGLEAEAERINEAAKKSEQRPVVLIPHVAGDDVMGIERQIAQMNELIAKDVDIIIAQPTDNAALVRPLKAANDAGIPVVAYDQYISGGKLTAYVTSDNYQAGYLDGEYIAWKFPDTQTLKLILVEYPHVSSTVERVNGLLDGLRDQKQPYKILRSYTAIEPKSGKIAGESILKDFPNPGDVDVVFSVNDGGGLAVVDVLFAAGRNEICIATIDGDPASVKNIEDGKLTCIDSAQFCGRLGGESMTLAYRILNGEHVAEHTLIPVFPVTPETRERYTGWVGTIPEGFQKPWPSKKPYWENTPRSVTNRE